MRAALVCVVLLYGCASTPREHPLREPLAGREVSLSRAAPPPRFELQGASRSEGYVVLGTVRGNVGVAVGGARPITRDPVLRLDDPAEGIGNGLLDTLQSRHAVRRGAGDLVLHVRTTAWNAELPDPANSARYRITYKAEARLVDSNGGRTLAEHRCDVRTDAPGFAELVANDGARLNAELARAGERCMAELRSRMLG